VPLKEMLKYEVLKVEIEIESEFINTKSVEKSNSLTMWKFVIFPLVFLANKTKHDPE